MEQLKPISIDELRALSQVVIELPPFDEGGAPVPVLIKRTSIQNLLVVNKTLNPVLKEAMDLFGQTKNKKVKENDQSPEQIVAAVTMIDEICQAVMVQPTFKEAKDLLTYEQKEFIFNYTQSGMKEVQSFRKDEGNT